MVKIDFSLCLHGSGAIVRNFEQVDFSVFLQWMQPGKEWDEVQQPTNENSPRYDHKTYNGYITSMMRPINKQGDYVKARRSNPQPGYRNAANVLSRSLIMLDFDSVPDGTMQKLVAQLQEEYALGVVYTTYNHMRPGKGERFRAVIATDRPMEPGEIGRASYAFFDRLREAIPGLEVDLHSFNPAFAMYRPPACSIVTPLDDGDAWSVDELLQEFDNLQLQLPVKALTSENWTPATPEDMERCEEWLQWADDNGLTVADGQIWVCCPEHDRHSTGSAGDGTDGGAAILLPSARKGEATFKCLHARCDMDVNRHQRDTMLAISQACDVAIPEHLLPDPHGGFAEEDRAAMRRMLAEQSAGGDEEDDEPQAQYQNGKRERERAPGAVNVADLPMRLGGKLMLDIRPDTAARLYDISKNTVYVVQGGESRYFQRRVNTQGFARWEEMRISTLVDVLSSKEGVIGGRSKGDKVEYKTVSLFEALHNWTGRIEKTGGAAIFPPPTKPPEDMLNTWEGFSADPQPGDVSVFRDYVRDVLCSGDRGLAHYFLQWLAHMVQHPGIKPSVAIVMHSGEGNGKGQLAGLLDRMMEGLFTQYNGTEKLTGQFNIMLMSTLCAFIDEAKAKGQENATIRGLVSESRAIFESKGSNQIRGRSFSRFIFASNEIVLKITKGDRRYCALTLNPRYAANKDNPERETFAKPYWEMYSDWVRQDWVPGAVLHFLLNYDLTGFDPYNAPDTASHMELVSQSLSLPEDWLLKSARDGTIKTRLSDVDDSTVVAAPSILTDLFIKYVNEYRFSNHLTPRSLETIFGKILKKTTAPRHETRRPGMPRYYYVFHSQSVFYTEICEALGVKEE